jgi:septum formation protein
MTSSLLVLASSSAYRKELLSRLQLPFEVAVPDIDETPHPGETPSATALRLAREKAAAVAAKHARRHRDRLRPGGHAGR